MLNKIICRAEFTCYKYNDNRCCAVCPEATRYIRKQIKDPKKRRKYTKGLYLEKCGFICEAVTEAIICKEAPECEYFGIVDAEEGDVFKDV